MIPLFFHSVAPMISQAKPPGNIFLIGLMGAGKSTIGQKLAQTLGKEFRDSDGEIEKRTGVGIDVIFDIEGEEGFRRREANMIRELTQERGIVMATGGGAVLAEENRQLLRNNGFVIYLQASVEHLVNRTRNDRQRPLLQSGDSFKTLSELLAGRGPIYHGLADLVVNTDGRRAGHVVREISQALEQV